MPAIIHIQHLENSNPEVYICTKRHGTIALSDLIDKIDRLLEINETTKEVKKNP
jgi:hypothetical protein